MSLASMIAKQVVKATGDMFKDTDIQKAISAQVDEVVTTKGLESKDGQDYLLRMTKAMVTDDPNFKADVNLDPNLGMYLEVENKLFSGNPDMREAYYAAKINNAKLGGSSEGDKFKYSEGGAVTRTIKRGDTLSKISKETGVSISDLVKLNNIENPDLIRAGDTLVLGAEAQAQPDRREVRKPVQREEPKRTGIRAVAVRSTKATPTESNNLMSRIGQSISDAKNALINEAIPINIRAFVGDLAGDDSTITEKNLSAEELETLRRLTLQNQAKNKPVFEYTDFETHEGDINQYEDVSGVASNIDVVSKTATSPKYALKTTLGQASITTDDDGNTIIRDRYNFNDAKDNFRFDEFMKDVVNAGMSGYLQARNIARYFGSGPGEGSEVEINLGKLNSEEFGTVAMLSQGRTQSAKGGKIDKKKMACNKPKRTASHPKKSHVVKACKDGKEKIIRFGEQGAKTAGKPKAGESKRMKAKRKSFKARHRKNIKRGNMSAAYWADKVKW